VAHWAELVKTTSRRSPAPASSTLGADKRAYVPIDRRPKATVAETAVSEEL
jgi:hypothetical protein